MGAYDVLKRIGELAEMLEHNRTMLETAHLEKIETAAELLRKIDGGYSGDAIFDICGIVSNLTLKMDCDTICKGYEYEISGAKDILSFVCSDIERNSIC